MTNKRQETLQKQLQDLSTWYESGQVFAYPTEAVYGLGCDPLNKDAVYKILSLKSREVEKGMILIASDFSQIAPFVLFEHLSQHTQQEILSSWPGPVTWLLPKSPKTPDWLSGDSNMLAVRISSHPLVSQMCNHLGKPIVSTSANPAGESPAINEQELRGYFGNELRVLEGLLGNQKSPSKIFHSLTMETIRA
ncbi:MAG: tRNA threonylcarbamoyl adenosine modification protein (Sua5/YciO/YrdC/YwlC family) [Alphaproteobacteria bacterium]|jgi:tRNA threonylcarbamoyl adenosine modification protein (Sua5/YciO/YrdC/YwlC family)